MRSAGMLSCVFRNHSPSVSASRSTAPAMAKCTLIDIEKTLPTCAMFPRPSSKLRKRCVAEDIAALRNENSTTTPPTTL